MATGDQNDIFSRLKSLLPANWWQSGQTPNLDAVVSGIASIKAQIYAAIAYTALQTRVTTSTDGWLDLAAADFFGNGLLRRQGQSDASYRALLVANLFRERTTRAGVTKLCSDLTGNTPTVIELCRPSDTGAWSKPGLYYGNTGAYASGGAYGTPGAASYAGTVIIKVARPASGSLQYGAQDADLYAGIDGVRPVTSTAWVQLQ